MYIHIYICIHTRIYIRLIPRHILHMYIYVHIYLLIPDTYVYMYIHACDTWIRITYMYTYIHTCPLHPLKRYNGIRRVQYEPLFWPHLLNWPRFFERKRCALNNAISLCRLKGGQFKRRGRQKRYTNFVAPKLLPKSQNSSHNQFSCRCQEPMSRAKYAYNFSVVICLGKKLRRFWLHTRGSWKNWDWPFLCSYALSN